MFQNDWRIVEIDTCFLNSRLEHTRAPRFLKNRPLTWVLSRVNGRFHRAWLWGRRFWALNCQYHTSTIPHLRPSGAACSQRMCHRRDVRKDLKDVREQPVHHTLRNVVSHDEDRNFWRRRLRVESRSTPRRAPRTVSMRRVTSHGSRGRVSSWACKYA